MPLLNAFQFEPEECDPVATDYRRIQTALPVPESIELLREAASSFPAVNCYQPPIVWDRAEGFQVHDAYGNCWIDFSSTAVTTNTGHGHPAIRERIARHAADGLLAQFSFLSEIRLRLARKLLAMTPDRYEKVYFWTTGSEAIESAYRLVHQGALRRGVTEGVVLSIANDYHGCTLGAHQLSGATGAKPWLPATSTPAWGRIDWPGDSEAGDSEAGSQADEPSPQEEARWRKSFDASLTRQNLSPGRIAGVFVEAMQGWGALPLPVAFARALRRWTEQHGIPLVFDEVQTGFGRTGRLFAFEHYGIEPDVICVGKGVTSGLPLAAVLGPAELLDLLNPGEVTTTHAAHPLSCAAALENLEILEREDLVARAASSGIEARRQLRRLQDKWPQYIARVTGLGLLNAIHLTDPGTGESSHTWAADLTWQAVRRGVMLFYTNQPTVKICPPLVIPPDALSEGIDALDEALTQLAGS